MSAVDADQLTDVLACSSTYRGMLRIIVKFRPNRVRAGNLRISDTFALRMNYRMRDRMIVGYV